MIQFQNEPQQFTTALKVYFLLKTNNRPEKEINTQSRVCEKRNFVNCTRPLNMISDTKCNGQTTLHKLSHTVKTWLFRNRTIGTCHCCECTVKLVGNLARKRFAGSLRSKARDIAPYLIPRSLSIDFPRAAIVFVARPGGKACPAKPSQTSHTVSGAALPREPQTVNCFRRESSLFL